MKNIMTSVVLLLALLATTSCGDSDMAEEATSGALATNKNANKTILCRYADRLEFPALRNESNNRIIVNMTDDAFDADGINYCVEWDSKLMAQRWSCYQMHDGFKVTGVKRYEGNPQYLFDPQLKEYFDGKDPFKGSGFDHGHICPSGDRLYSTEANQQTFYLTNMQPQYNQFNANLWENLESKIRIWCKANGVKNIYVCKGATIDNPSYILKRINDKLIVPKYFFCALLMETSVGFQAVAFWMENEDTNRNGEPLGNYAMSVDELENLTGIDFFCNLPDNIESACEAKYEAKVWGL